MTKRKNNGVQGLIGFERFTRFGVKTDKAEIAFFSVELSKRWCINYRAAEAYAGRQRKSS